MLCTPIPHCLCGVVPLPTRCPDLFFWFRGMPSHSRKLCLDELTSPGVSLGEQLRLVGIGNAPLPCFWTNLTRIFHLELPCRIKLNFSLPGITRLVFSPSLSCFSHSLTDFFWQHCLTKSLAHTSPPGLLLGNLTQDVISALSTPHWLPT